MFICTDPSVIQRWNPMSVLDHEWESFIVPVDVMWEILYPGFLVNLNSDVEIRSIPNPDFLVNQNPKSADVDEFIVRDEFSDSSFSV